MAAFIGPLIGLGASLIGSAFKKKPQPDPMISRLANQNQLATADAQATTGQAKNYYTTALSGDKEALRELLGPEVSTVLSQYDTAAKAATALGPRGAGRNAVNAAVPFEKAAAYGKALTGARSGAADALGKIGTTEEGQANQLNSTLLGANESQNKLDYEKEKDSNSMLSSFGGGLASALLSKNGAGQSGAGQIGNFFSKIFGGGGGGTGVSNGMYE